MKAFQTNIDNRNDVSQANSTQPVSDDDENREVDLGFDPCQTEGIQSPNYTSDEILNPQRFHSDYCQQQYSQHVGFHTQ